MGKHKMYDAQNRLCHKIINDMRYLHERVSLTCGEEVHNLHELMTAPEGELVIKTLQILSRDIYSSFAVYRYESAKILTDPSEMFAHQIDLMSSLELAKIECPRLTPLICVMGELTGKQESDIHGTRFVQASGGKSISVERNKTETGETIAFSFKRSSDHNYYMSFYPKLRLTTALGEKMIDEIIEEADITFIRNKSKGLIDWAYKVLGYL